MRGTSWRRGGERYLDALRRDGHAVQHRGVEPRNCGDVSSSALMCIFVIPPVKLNGATYFSCYVCV